MSKLLLLTRILLKNGINTGVTGKKKPKQILLFLFIGLCFAPLLVSLIAFVSSAYDVLSGIEQEGLLLGLGFSATSFVIFFFGIFIVINTFYFSKDVEILLPLPFKPSQILGAKFLVATIYEYLTESFVLLPLLIVYGIKSSASPAFYLYGLMIFLILPVFPLVISSFIVLVVMRFTGIGKNKDRFRMIAGVLSLGIAIGSNVLIQKFTTSALTQKDAQSIINAGQNSLATITSKIFPTSHFAVFSMLNTLNLQGLFNFIIFTAISVVGFMLFMLLGEALYFKGVIGISEMSQKREKLTSEKLQKETSRRSPLISYTLNEIRLLFRTPIYFMNCILVNFLWPIFMLIPFMTQKDGFKNIKEMVSLIDQDNNPSIFLAVGVLIFIFITGSNGITSSSISREGQNFYISKYLPIPYMTQIMAKVLTGMIISTSGLIITIVVLVFVLTPPSYTIVPLIICGTLGILFTMFTGIFLDLQNPKLVWENETKAVKQNMNLLFNMLVSLFFAIVTLVPVMILYLPFTYTFLIILITYTILNFIIYKILASKATKLYESIES